MYYRFSLIMTLLFAYVCFLLWFSLTYWLFGAMWGFFTGVAGCMCIPHLCAYWVQPSFEALFRMIEKEIDKQP